MKKVLSLLLFAFLLVSLTALPVAAAVSYTPEAIEQSGEAYLRLTHANVVDFMMYRSSMEAANGEKPLPDSLSGEVMWGIGPETFERDHCCFIMGGINGGSYEEQIPAYVAWDVSAGYEFFQAYVGAGNWGHSSGFPSGSGFKFQVAAVDAENNETVLVETPEFHHMGDAPIAMIAALPEGTQTVKVYLWCENGNYGSSSCVIADAIAYQVADGGEPTTGVDTMPERPQETIPALPELTLPPEDEDTNAPDSVGQGTNEKPDTSSQTTATPQKSDGCGSLVTSGVWAVAMLAAAPIWLKKKR